MPDQTDYESTIFWLRDAPRRSVSDPGALPRERDTEVPSQDALRIALRAACPAVQALAVSLAMELAGDALTPERIVDQRPGYDQRMDEGAWLGDARILASRWQLFRASLQAFAQGDRPALRLTRLPAIEIARWCSHPGPGHTYAFAHMAAVQGIALFLLEFESALESTEAHRSDPGILAAEYLRSTLQNISLVRRGQEIHRVQYGEVIPQPDVPALLPEWWAYAKRRFATREGLGVQMNPDPDVAGPPPGLPEWRPGYEQIRRGLERPRVEHPALPVRPERVIYPGDPQLPEEILTYDRREQWARVLTTRFMPVWSLGVRRAAILAALRLATRRFPVQMAEDAGSVRTGLRELLEVAEELAVAWMDGEEVLYRSGDMQERLNTHRLLTQPRPGFTTDWLWRDLHTGLSQLLQLIDARESSEAMWAEVLSLLLSSAVETAHALDPPDSSPYPTEPPVDHGTEMLMAWWDDLARMLPLRKGTDEPVL